MQNKTVTLSFELAQSVVNYLGTKPYSEVATFILSIQKEVQDQSPVENTKVDKAKKVDEK